MAYLKACFSELGGLDCEMTADNIAHSDAELFLNSRNTSTAESSLGALMPPSWFSITVLEPESFWSTNFIMKSLCYAPVKVRFRICPKTAFVSCLKESGNISRWIYRHNKCRCGRKYRLAIIDKCWERRYRESVFNSSARLLARRNAGPEGKK